LSASGPSPLHFPHNGLARRGAASNAYEAPAARGEFVLDKQSDWSTHDTKCARRYWTLQAVGKPLEQGGVYRSEGFG
jgi:hypothetical protein